MCTVTSCFILLVFESYGLKSTFQPAPIPDQDFVDVMRRADILQRVMASINSGLALEPLLSNILGSSVTLIEATHGTIGLVIERNGRSAIRTVAVYNMPDEELGAEMAPGVGLAGRVLQEERTIHLDRYGDLEQPTLPELAEHSVIGVPIRWGEEMIGFFGIGGESPRRFSVRDAETLELFAQYAAIVIHNANLFEASQQALNEMRLLYETSQRISLSGDVDEVIAAYLDQVAGHGRYVCSVCLYDFDEQGNRVAIIVRGRWSPDEGLQRLEERLPYSRDDLDTVLETGQTVAIVDVRTDPRVPVELSRMQEESGRLALVMIPLMVRGQRIGLVVLSYPGVHEWNEAGLRPYQATAVQLANAVDSRLQQGLLFERGQELAVLQERQRLARELHDSVTQLIFSSTLIAQSLTPAWKRDPVEGQRRLDRLLELSQTALREMRTLLLELRPSDEIQRESRLLSDQSQAGQKQALTGPERVRRYGLLDALRQLGGDFSHEGIEVSVDTSGYNPPHIDSEEIAKESGLSKGQREELAFEEGIYRIVQESLNNAVKHAHARRILIRLDGSEPKKLFVSVKDDGMGFVPKAGGANYEAQTGGFGMYTMRERAEALGGSLQIISAPGAGTTVEVTIPIRKIEL